MKPFQDAFLTSLKDKHFDLLETLSKELTKEAEEQLKRLLESSKQSFAKS